MSKSDALLRELPWVIERKTLVDCDGVVWDRVARRDITRTPGGRLVMPDRAMCRNEARSGILPRCPDPMPGPVTFAGTTS